ncbi:MAG: UDP-glucose/GDP-mannose dehydrogenase family protein [Thermodesulfobacteriota bacterium]
MNICVVGTGYVGLVTGACFAELGLNVTCVDKEEEKIETLKSGEVPIYEPGLKELIRKNVDDERLSFTTNIKEGVENALAVFIAVGTPSNPDGSADLSYIREVAKNIGEVMNGYKVITTKSTVPVGTGRLIEKIVKENQKKEVVFDVASNPEFLREGSAIEDFMRPDRVVVGADSDQAKAILKDLYRPLYLIEAPFIMTDIETAEMIKYASNAFLATKISFINEIANLCEKVDADVHVVAKAMGLDRRIGPKFLHPGPGYGGSCFPKDTFAINQIAKDNDYDFKIINAVLKVNERQKELMAEKIERALCGLDNKKIAVWGLTFKPNTDDMRDAPSVVILNKLIAGGSTVSVYDPAGMDEAKKFFKDKVIYSNNMYDMLEGCDALVVMTEWNQFRNPDWSKIKDALKQPLIVDLRNVYEVAKMKELGFQYYSVGR